MTLENKAQYPFTISSEVDRLQKQHTWINHVLKNKIVFAPVPLDKEGLKILDVGCADGTVISLTK
jgi:2-polyprenyl-3-methyl-5-hydroxy-6-metoxy-1,4-benzoquinol methylase